MINLTGCINLVTDLQTAMFSLQHSKVIYIGELNQQIPQDCFITYSNLLPPYDAIDAEIDGNMEMYNMLYSAHLYNNEHCFNAFATIIVALYKGVNITLYIENGNSLAHTEFLLNYMRTIFGITCGTYQNMYSFDPNYSAQTAIILYSFLDGFISLPQLLLEAPIESILAMNNIPYINPLEKACREENINPAMAIQWLTSYRNRLLMLMGASKQVPKERDNNIIERIKKEN